MADLPLTDKLTALLSEDDVRTWLLNQCRGRRGADLEPCWGYWSCDLTETRMRDGLKLHSWAASSLGGQPRLFWGRPLSAPCVVMSVYRPGSGPQ
jgi:hypothetical protein